MKECERLASEFDLSFAYFDSSGISEKMKSEIADKIRAIIPQRRGGIVTSRKMILPLSGTKKLNLGNTPILVVEDDEGSVYVFPCRLGETYYGLEDGIAHLRSNLPKLPPLTGLSEKDLTAIILKQPELLEKGLHDPSEEVETSAGTIDIVFRDVNERKLLVEVEREADDAPLGQILRLCAAYQKKLSLSRESVRGVIVCMRAREFIQDAAKRAGIEIKIIEAKNL